MTGLSPAAFHAREGVGEWRVTSRGAEAVFRAVSLAHAGRARLPRGGRDRRRRPTAPQPATRRQTDRQRQAGSRTHLDLILPAEVARERVDAALAAGGRLVDDSHAPAFRTVASPDNHGVDIAAWMNTSDGS